MGKKEFNLTFDEALELCNAGEMVQGDNFSKGIYIKFHDSSDTLKVYKSRDLGWIPTPLIISRNILNQKYRLITCVIQAEEE